MLPAGATPKWQYYNTRTAQWVDFPKRLAVMMEKNFATSYGGSKPLVVEHGDVDYRINFQEMRAIDTMNFHRWLDIRRVAPSAPSPQAPPSPTQQQTPTAAVPPSSPRTPSPAPAPPA
eukprot:RCo032552